MATPQITFRSYYWRVLSQIGRDITEHVRATAFAVIGAIVVAVLLATYRLIPTDQTWPRAIISAIPSVGILIIYLLYHGLRAPWKLHNQTHEERDAEVQVMMERQQEVRRVISDAHEGARAKLESVQAELASTLASIRHYPVVSIQFASPAPYSGFELAAFASDAFLISVQLLAIGEITLGWQTPRRSLRAGDSMPISITEIGQSGHVHHDEVQVALHLALETQASEENPIVDSAILIDYRDIDGKQWQSKGPIRYDKRTQQIELSAPDVNPVPPMPFPDPVAC